MRLFKRKFIKLLALSLISSIFPTSFLVASAKKVINPNLSKKQKEIMFKEGTERPYSNDLLKEKRKGFSTVLTVEINYSLQQLNLIVEPVGHLFQRPYRGLLKLKLIIVLEWKGLSIIVLSVEHIMDTFLMMALENQVKDFVVMDFV